ncbi:MAG: class I SAM-dependent methyltransferase [Chthoniobacterales bacterium]
MRKSDRPLYSHLFRQQALPVMRFRFLAAVLLAGSALAQPAPRGTSDPYAGDLAIFEKPDRDAKLQTDRVMDLLGITAGSRVADIGAGSGWFSVRAARRVGKTGAVYAVEINPAYLRYIKRRATTEKLANIRTILGRPGNPLLAKASVDAVMLLKTYHEVQQPMALLRHVREAMRPGARLAIIDRNGVGTDHGLNADVVIKEALEAGFTLVAQHDFVKSDDLDYFLIFQAALPSL